MLAALYLLDVNCKSQRGRKAQGPPETGVDKSGVNQHSTKSLVKVRVIALDREDYLIFIHVYARHSSDTVSVMPLFTNVTMS